MFISYIGRVCSTIASNKLVKICLGGGWAVHIIHAYRSTARLTKMSFAEILDLTDVVLFKIKNKNKCKILYVLYCTRPDVSTRILVHSSTEKPARPERARNSLRNKDVRRHAKQGKTCAVKGAWPVVPHCNLLGSSLGSVKACRGKNCCLSVGKSAASRHLYAWEADLREKKGWLVS